MGITPEHVDIHQPAFYKHHTRHAERWREGRVLLVGDAAHLMPPWAGSGMQSGIRDAFNLACKLREVQAGRLPDKVLDSDEAERAPNVALTTAMSEQMGRIFTRKMRPPEVLMALVGRLYYLLGWKLPPSPLGLPPHVEAGWIRGAVVKASAVGRMIPQPRIANASGRHMWLDEALGNGFVLLGAAVHGATLFSDRGLTTQQAAIGAGLAGVGALLDRYFGPRIAMAVFCLGAVGLFVNSTASVFPVMVAATFLGGMAMGAEGDLLPYFVRRYFGTRAFGAIFGVVFVAYTMGGMLGPIAYGLAFDKLGGYTVIVQIAAAACIFSALALVFCGPYRYQAAQRR